MKHLTQEKEFDQFIKDKTVLVDFFATWCGPCQLLNPVLEEVEQELKEITIVKVDIDQFKELAHRYGVMVVPTIKVFKSGKLIKSHSGYLEKEEIKNLLK